MKKTMFAIAVVLSLSVISFAGFDGINYQGRIVENGALPTGYTNVTFLIYNNQAGPGALLYQETDTGVQVIDGFYQTVIGDNPAGGSPYPLDEALLASSEAWLEVTLGSTTLTPRERINGVGYAFHAQTLEGKRTNDFFPASGGTIMVTNRATVITAFNIATNFSFGLYGYTASAAWKSAGVIGIAGLPSNADGDQNEGIAGVRGDAKEGIGVVGTSAEGPGVWGISSNFYGVVALSHNDPALYAASDTGEAIEADGSVRAWSFEFDKPRTNFYAVPSMAFQPRGNEDYNFNDPGIYLTDGHGGVYAPVHLPHNATVTKVEVRFYDTDPANNIDASLTRVTLTGVPGGGDLAAVNSSGSSGWQTQTDTSISNAQIDNQNFGYYAYAWCTAWKGTLKLMGFVITYTVDELP